MNRSTANTRMLVDRIREWIGADATGGVLLMIAAVAALAWANSPWRDAYQDLLSVTVGPESLHMNLSLAHWAADGLLAVFFFVVGVELKQEFVAGDLRNPRSAGVPIAAAVGGMVVPAVVYAAIVGGVESEALRGWATPTATDIAFALGVLALFGRGLPVALRVFLMTLAVVDDLLGIIVIATVYTESIDLGMLAAGVACIVVFGVCVRADRTHWWVLLPPAVAAWGFVHASGVHATVAGVLLGFTVPAVVRAGESLARTERFAATITPLSTAVCLPLFAFASAGVTVVGSGHILQPVSIGVFCGLVFGKVVGVMATVWVVTRVTPLRLPDAVGIRDLLPVGFLTGIGFTVALLIAELSFSPDAGLSPDHEPAAKVGILVGSVTAAVLGAVMLRWDARRVRSTDENRDGVPDRDRRVI